MGCDYYRSSFLIIDYIDNDDKQHHEIVLLDKCAQYFVDGEFDSDFMTHADYFAKLKKNYPNKDLYKHGKWFCLASAIDEYQYRIKKLSVKELLHVYKMTEFNLLI